MSSIPCQDNTNNLYSSYFQLKILRGTSRLELMVQSANLPGITIPDQAQPTIFGTTIPVPSMTAQFEPLFVEFLVDQDLENWKSIYSWMRNVTNIRDAQEYPLAYQNWHYTASLIIPNGVYKYNCPPTPALTITFANIVPVKLSGLPFKADVNDAIPLKATCTFKYSYYTMSPDAPSNLNNSTN